MKMIRAVLAFSSVFALAISAGSAQAFVVNIAGIDYEVDTFAGSYGDNIDTFATPENGGLMPWWGNQALAIAFTNAVGLAGGDFIYSNNLGTEDYAPFFSYQISGPVVPSSALRLGFGQDIAFPFTANEFEYATATPVASPSAVPGPLPLFGAAAAFGMSRHLRRRIRLDSGSNQG